MGNKILVESKRAMAIVEEQDYWEFLDKQLNSNNINLNVYNLV